MPEIIAENHHLFIRQFLRTGKHKLIGTTRHLFLKTKEGYIVPVQMSLFLNFLNYQHMTLFFQLEKDNNPFESEEGIRDQIGTILLNENFQVMEFSKNCSQVCRLSLDKLRTIKEQTSGSLYFDDLFQVKDVNNMD